MTDTEIEHWAATGECPAAVDEAHEAYVQEHSRRWHAGRRREAARVALDARARRAAANVTRTPAARMSRPRAVARRRPSGTRGSPASGSSGRRGDDDPEPPASPGVEPGRRSLPTGGVS